MDYLFEIAGYFNSLSDKADKIKQLDRDSYKHYTDKEILETIINEKISELEENQEKEIELYKKALREIIDLRSHFEYTDEWQEAEAYCKSEEIAKKALSSEEKN